MEAVADRLNRVRERILRACTQAGRAIDDVCLVAVSKTVSDSEVRSAFEAGQRDFGENRMQEALPKLDAVPEARWHFVGRLQSNKARSATRFALVHSLDRKSLLDALAAAGSPQHPIECLLEVNLGQETQKGGVLAADAEALLVAALERPGLRVRGLMTVPPQGQSVRVHFEQLRKLRDRLQVRTGEALPELSMGMSSDFEDGILEGATMVRVGTAIFGPRR